MRAYCYTIITWLNTLVFKLFIHQFACLLIYQNIYFVVCLFICVSVYLFILTRSIIYLISLCELSPYSSFMHVFANSYIIFTLVFMFWFALIFQCLMYSNHSLLIIVYCLSDLHYSSCLVLFYLNKQPSKYKVLQRQIKE